MNVNHRVDSAHIGFVGFLSKEETEKFSADSLRLPNLSVHFISLYFEFNSFCEKR